MSSKDLSEEVSCEISDKVDDEFTDNDKIMPIIPGNNQLTFIQISSRSLNRNQCLINVSLFFFFFSRK